MNETGSATRGLRAEWAWAALIASIAALAFQSAQHGALLAWDDDINLLQNPHLRPLTWENVRWMFTDVAYMRRYVPLTWLDWAIGCELFGLTARSCHVGNIVFHAANAVLVSFVVARVLRAWRRERPLAEDAVMFAAALAALVWAVHPLRVEVVAWASGRIYCQAAFFLLLATLSYLRAADPASPPRAVWRWLSLGAFTASLLTYPIGASYLGLLVVLDVWVLRRFATGGGFWRDARNRTVWMEKIPFLLVTVAVAAVTVLARFRATGLWEPPPTLAQFGLGPRVMQALYIWAHYVWRPFVPFDLAPVYATLVEFDPRGAPFVASAIGVIAVTALLTWRRHRWPGAFALWIAHLVLLAPVLGFTEYPHYPADRYSYLQGVLWAIAMATAIAGLRVRVARAPIATAAAALGVALGVLTHAQIRIWHDSETLFRHLHARLAGNNYRADIAARLGETLRIQGRLPEAVPYYEEALRLDPSWKIASVAHFGLGLATEASGRRDDAARHYEEALRFDPRLEEARRALVRVRDETRR